MAVKVHDYDLVINGNVTADFFIGDGSLLTNLPGGVTTAYSETPAGSVNSSNVTYTLANTPNGASGVIILLNGVTQYNGIDYTVSGSTITFTTAPITGSSIHAYYNTFTAGGGSLSGSGTTNELAYWTGASALGTLPVATYPSLTELVHVKGVTSNIQTQINGKQATISLGTGVQTALGVNIGSTGAFVTDTSANTLTNKTLTSPVINTPTGIVKADIGLSNVDNTSDATKNSATATLTNKRIEPRSSTAASGDISPDLATANIYQRTAISATIAINAPTGTPVLGEVLVLMLLDNGTTRTLNWNAAYTTRVMGSALPTATTVNKQMLVTCQFNGTTWLCLSVNEV